MPRKMTLAAEFSRRYPQTNRVQEEKQILEDPTVQLVLSSIIPPAEKGAAGYPRNAAW